MSSGGDPTPANGAPPTADSLLPSGAFIDASNLEETREAQLNGSAGRAKANGSDPELPDWLPEDWRVEYRVRRSGSTAGRTDRYYHDPVSGCRYRSKNEVLNFLKKGTPKKNADSDKTRTVESSPNKRQRKSSPKPDPGVTYDSSDVPAKVEWVLTDTTQWTWAPFIDGQKVPESTTKEWAAAFTDLSSSKSDRTH